MVRTKRNARTKRVKKGLIDAHVFHILVLCVLHKSSAAGAFLGGPKGNKASRSSGRWKCSHSSFSLRDSLCQYSETHWIRYLCFSSSGRASFQSDLTVLRLQISSTISYDTSLFGNIVPHVLSRYCGSNLNYRPLSLFQQIFQPKMCGESFVSVNPIWTNSKESYWQELRYLGVEYLPRSEACFSALWSHCQELFHLPQEKRIHDHQEVSKFQEEKWCPKFLNNIKTSTITIKGCGVG